jgi:hypothetical protein
MVILGEIRNWQAEDKKLAGHIFVRVCKNVSHIDLSGSRKLCSKNVHDKNTRRLRLFFPSAQ